MTKVVFETIKDKKGVKDKTKLKELGQQLKVLRESHSLSQEDFAKRINFTRVYINEIENGKWLPSYNFWKKLTEIYKDIQIKLILKDGLISVILEEKEENE